MRGFLRRLAACERGAAVTVYLLVLAPLLVMVTVASLDLTQAVSAVDYDLKDAVAEAARGAATQVNGASQAAGDPRIDPDRAHLAFRRVLAKNLGLDEVSLAPLPGSSAAAPVEYMLVVYNGDDAYAADGAPAGRVYRLWGGVYGEEVLSGAGFPREFGVSGEGVALDGSGARTVELKSPGTVAVVRVRLAGVTGTIGPPAVRWAAARVVKVRP